MAFAHNDKDEDLLPSSCPAESFAAVVTCADVLLRWGGAELCAEVGDGMKGKAAYRGGVQRLHFSTEGVIRRDD